MTQEQLEARKRLVPAVVEQAKRRKLADAPFEVRREVLKMLVDRV